MNIRTNTNNGISIIPTYIVLIFIALLLFIDFIPNTSGVLIANAQFLYLSVLNLLIGIYFYVNLKMISTDIIPILRRNYLTLGYLVFLLICGLSVIAAKNTSLVITRITELIIIFCLFLNLTILLKDKLNLLYRIVLIISISAFFQSGLALYKFTQFSRYVSVAEALNTMTGNTGNINILAASLTIKVPFLLLGITYFTGIKKKFLLFILFFVTTAIFLTGARASLLSLGAIIFVYIFYYLKTHSFSKLSLIKSFVLILPIIIALFVSNRSFEKSKDNERYKSVENRITQINTTDASAKARLAYWGNALKMSQANPLLGIGLGNYRIESIPYEKTTENDFTVSLDPHNDFLEVLAETGIVNAILYLSLFVFVFFVNTIRIVKSTDDVTKSTAVLSLMLLLVYGCDAFFNFPMYKPTMQIFFSLLLALTLVNSRGFIQNHLSFKIKTFPILIGIAIITSCSAFLIYKASNLEGEIIKDDINNKLKGTLTGDEIIKRMPHFPNVFLTSESFYEYAAIYYIREKKYDKALSCFAKASKINPYSGRINFYKYFISKEKGNIDSAYIYSKEAFYMRPRNLFYYKYSTNLAALKKDTIEILKEHKLFSKFRKIPEAWTIPANELQKTNFNQKKLIHFIDQGLKEIPNDSTLLNLKKDILVKSYTNEGQLFLAQSKFDKAIPSYQKALEIDSKNIYIMQNIGLCYYFSGQYKQAITYFLDALKYPGLNNGMTEFYIATCYSKMNDLENACHYFNVSKSKNFAAAQLQLNKTCK